MEEIFEMPGQGAAQHNVDEISVAGASVEEFTFELRPFRQITLDRSQQWLISKLMPRRGLHVVYGAPSTGKSFVALSAALHVAAGKLWAGHRVYQGGVVYIAAEGGRAFCKRVYAAKKALNLPDDLPFALITRAPKLGGPDDETEELIEDIRLQCKRLKFSPQLIVLDTLSRSIPALRESDAQDIMKFVGHAQRIAEAFDAIVMPIHHCGKDETKGMRGSSALHAAADCEWLIRRDENGHGRVVVEKMKDGAAAGALRYDLKQVDLDTDEQGEVISTCVVALDAEANGVDTTEASLSALCLTQQAKTLVGLQMLTELEGQKPPVGSSIPEGVKVLAMSRVKIALSVTGLLANNKKAAEVGLRRSLEALALKKVVCCNDTFVWLEQITGADIS